MTVTIIILCLSAILFVNGRIRSDLVAVCTALSLVLCGILSPEEALAGFANPIVIMMAGLFVVGEGIFSTGLAGRVGHKIMGLAGGNETRLFVLVMLATSLVGAFVSNTGTVALMLPIVVSLCRAAGFSQSRLLMPLAFAGSMGGMLTLIGTPPNLIVRDALVQAGYAPLGFFSFAPVGILCIVTGILVLLPLTRRFLKSNGQTATKPSGKSPVQLAEEYKLTQGLTRLVIEAGSPFAGKTLRELDVYGRYGITVFEIRRTSQTGGGAVKRVEQFTLAETALSEGDQLFLSGAPQSVELLAAENRLKITKPKKGGNLHFYDIGLAEILVLPSSSLVGQSVAEAAFREQHGLNVYGVKRHEQHITSNLKDLKLHAADILLVQGPWSNIARLNRDEGREWVVIGQPEKQAARITLDYKAPLGGFYHGGDGCRDGFAIHSRGARHGCNAGGSRHGVYRMRAQRGGGIQEHQLGKHCALRRNAPHVDGIGKDGRIVCHIIRPRGNCGRCRALRAARRYLPGDLRHDLLHFKYRHRRTHVAHRPRSGHGTGRERGAHADGRDGSGKYVFRLSVFHSSQCPRNVGGRLSRHRLCACWFTLTNRHGHRHDHRPSPPFPFLNIYPSAISAR